VYTSFSVVSFYADCTIGMTTIVDLMRLFHYLQKRLIAMGLKISINSWRYPLTIFHLVSDYSGHIAPTFFKALEAQFLVDY
jgi:hypothetical protein